MSTVATTPRSQPYVPWHRRMELDTLLPGVVLALTMLWSVVQSVASSNWAEGLGVLVSVALPALLVGVLFARLRWLPGWLAHLLSAALGIAWAVQRVGPLLTNEIRGELGTALAERLTSWSDRAIEIVIRSVTLARVVQAGGRGEDIVLFIVALALLMWTLGYTSGWLLFRVGWTWWAVVLNALVILINYTFASPKPNTLFFLFLGAALLLVVHQHIVGQQRTWQSSLIDYPEAMPWRFLLAAALFCALVVLVTSLLPGNVSSAQVARTWRVVSSPLTAVREGWEVAFSTINAPPGSTGGGFFTRSVRVGGGRALGDAVVFRISSSEFDYWRAIARDRYTGRGWDNTVGDRARADVGTTTAEAARTPIEPGVTAALQQLDLSGRMLVTQTVELTQDRSDDLLVMGGQFASAGLPVLIEHGFLSGTSGAPLPNFTETSAVFAQLPLQQTQVYTVTSLISVADVQSLRNAGTSYPAWARGPYVQLPDTVSQRTRDLARQIVDDAGATTPYDQAVAIQSYLRRLTYDEMRRMPPEGRDWADHFLFESQVGYCDDFATAMVVLLRSLDVPARWVQGYAGGTLDPQIGAYVVRESVAHTWPEVYFPGYGWQRFEPTPASYASVPSRPSQPDEAGDDSSVPGSNQALIPDIYLDRTLEDLEDDLLLSSADIEASRLALLERQRAEQQRQIAIIVAVVVGLAGLGWLLVWRLRREERGLSPVAAVYLRLGRLASWAGLRQEPHMTPYEYAGELGRKLPQQRGAVERIADAYVSDRYNGAASRPAADVEQDWRSLQRPLLARMLSRLGALPRPRRKVVPHRRRRP